MQIQQVAQAAKDHLDSATSYTIGGAGVLLAIGEYAKTGTLIGGFVVIAIRAIYDAVKLYRYLRNKKADGTEG